MTGISAGVAVIVGTALGWWGAAAVVVVAAAVGAIRRQPGTSLACGVAAAAAMLGAWRAQSVASAPLSIASALANPVVVVTAPVATGRQQYFTVAASNDPRSDGDGAQPRTCVSAGPVPAVRLGDRLRLQGDIQSAGDLPLGRRASLAARGCAGATYAVVTDVIGATAGPARAVAEIRTRIGAALRSSAPGDAGVLLSGLVTGDDNGFSPAREDAFIRTGTTHLTAVSGSNLALVVGILATVGAATVGRHRWWWQAVIIGGAWVYAIVSGSQAPAVRAALVATAAVLAFRVGRRPDFPTLILLAAGVMVLLEPAQVDALGFRLSVASSLALAIVLPGLVTGGRHSPLVSVLAATTAAQLATLPLLLPVFGTVSLASLPANIVVAPIVAFIMPLAVLSGLAGAIWAPLGDALAAPAALAAQAMLAIVDAFGEPAAYISVGVPPLGAVIAIAGAACASLAVMSGDAARGMTRLGQSARRAVRKRNARDRTW
jgi:competence protein ComEC